MRIKGRGQKWSPFSRGGADLCPLLVRVDESKVRVYSFPSPPVDEPVPLPLLGGVVGFPLPSVDFPFSSARVKRIRRRASLSSIPGKKCSVGVRILLCVNSLTLLAALLRILKRRRPNSPISTILPLASSSAMRRVSVLITLSTSPHEMEEI